VSHARPVSGRRVRAAVVGAGLAACVVGLAGADAGLLWIVAGVFTVRSVWGEPPGYAWGVLCLGAGARWGTLSLGDVETAARIFGPAAAAGSFAVRVGTGVAIGAALLSEARIDGLRSSSWATRAASLAAILAIVGITAAPGPGRSGLTESIVWWAAAGVVVLVITLALARAARRVPAWVPPAAAAVGVAAALIAS